MQVISSASEMTEFSQGVRSNGQSIGFVPTMGALHAGHASLVENSTTQNNITVASVFVNPTQFNEPSDLHNYPRTFDADHKLLSELNADIMFYPSVEEIYSDEAPKKYELDGLDALMEGPNRPGHFQGVVQVVSRLFDIVLPHKAYFGQKDFQQLTILRYMSNKLGYDIEIIGCPTIREPNGLAMSSRNIHLTEEAKNESLTINRTLVHLREDLLRLGFEPAKNTAIKTLRSNRSIELEYLELVDPKNLQLATAESEKIQACIAAWVGGVRLIDNMRVK